MTNSSSRARACVDRDGGGLGLDPGRSAALRSRPRRRPARSAGRRARPRRSPAARPARPAGRRCGCPARRAGWSAAPTSPARASTGRRLRCRSSSLGFGGGGRGRWASAVRPCPLSNATSRASTQRASTPHRAARDRPPSRSTSDRRVNDLCELPHCATRSADAPDATRATGATSTTWATRSDARLDPLTGQAYCLGCGARAHGYTAVRETPDTASPMPTRPPPPGGHARGQHRQLRSEGDHPGRRGRARDLPAVGRGGRRATAVQPQGAAGEPAAHRGRRQRHRRPRPRPGRLGPHGRAGHRDPVHPRPRDHAGLHRRALRGRPRHHARGRHRARAATRRRSTRSPPPSWSSTTR